MAKNRLDRFAATVHVGLRLDQKNPFSIAPPLADQSIAELFFDRNLVSPRNLIDDHKPQIMTRTLVVLAGIPETRDEFHQSIPEDPDRSGALGLLATFLLLFRHLWHGCNSLRYRSGRSRSLFNRRRYDCH